MLFAFFGLELFLSDIAYRCWEQHYLFVFFLISSVFVNWLWCVTLVWFSLLCLVFFELYGCVGLQFWSNVEKFLLLYLQILFLFFPPSSPPGMLITCLLHCLIMSHKSRTLVWFFSPSFFSLTLIWIVSIAVSSNSLVSFSAVFNLPLCLFSEFFISGGRYFSCRRHKRELNGILFLSCISLFITFMFSSVFLNMESVYIAILTPLSADSASSVCSCCAVCCWVVGFCHLPLSSFDLCFGRWLFVDWADPFQACCKTARRV